MPKESVSDFDLVLVGGGHAHLAVLESLARTRVRGLTCCLVTPGPQSIYSGMVPGWMAGFFASDAIQIDVAALASAAGITLVLDEAVGLEAGRKRLHLRSGRMMGYGTLSLATGGETDVSPLVDFEGLLLAAKPVDRFFSRWPMAQKTASASENFRMAIVGGGAAGCELALAARAATGAKPTVILVTGKSGLLAGYPLRTRQLIEASLRAARITLAPYDAAGSRDGLLLADGTLLPCDAVIAATGTRPPAWLSESGLALSPEGYVMIDAAMRSVSNADVFAAGDITVRLDSAMERSGVHAVKSGPVLAHNLRAQFEDLPLRAYRPRRQSLYILSTADEQAVLSWRGFSFGGKLAWRIKKAIDQNFMRRYRL